jgi:hypothetical protein
MVQPAQRLQDDSPAVQKMGVSRIEGHSPINQRQGVAEIAALTLDDREEVASLAVERMSAHSRFSSTSSLRNIAPRKKRFRLSQRFNGRVIPLVHRAAPDPCDSGGLGACAARLASSRDVDRATQ